MSHLEAAKRDAVRTGNEIWPPDFASFIGHCKPKLGRMWKSLPKPQIDKEENSRRWKALIADMKK